MRAVEGTPEPMLEHLIIAVVTALLSSAATLGAAWWLFERRYRQRLERHAEKLLAEFGELLEERVRRGVIRAVADLPSGAVLRETTTAVTRRGASMVENGLNVLLGRRDPPK